MSRRPAPVLVLLLAFNLLCWLWALAALSGPALIGSALLAWMFGLRHALDVDHIAAIDNLTRRLVRPGRRPLEAGLFFSLGHSSVVALACVAILLARDWFQSREAWFAGWGAVAGTLVSGAFLLLIGAANLLLLLSNRRGAAHSHAEPFAPLSRLLFPLLRRVESPRGLLGLGMLFGLGFDTASEIGVLAIAATSAGGIGWNALCFPALFAAGMSLVDTLDGLMMAHAFGWAQADPQRRRGYDRVVTGVSCFVAFAVGAVELLPLASGGTAPGFAGVLSGILADHGSLLGASVVVLFATLFLAALVLRRMRARPA